jgi:hypothetical protein
MTGGQFSCTAAPGSGTLAQLTWNLGDAERKTRSRAPARRGAPA